MKQLSSVSKVISLVVLAFVLILAIFTPNVETNAASSQKLTLKKHTYKGISTLKYPQVSGIDKKAASKINSTLKKTAEKSYKSYLSFTKTQKERCKNKKCKYAFNSYYFVKNSENGKLSIEYFEYAYTGGKDGKTTAKMLNFDTKTGKYYTIDDILKTCTDYKKVQKYAFNYMSKNEPYSKTVKKLSDVKVDKNTQFSFYKDGIYLVYRQYGMQYDDGNPFIKIPKSVYK